MTLGPVDPGYTAVVPPLTSTKPGAAKTASDADEVVDFGGSGEVASDGIELSDEAKAKKAELEAKKKEEEEKKKIHEEILKIQEEITELEEKLFSEDENIDTDAINAKLNELFGQIGELKSKLGNLGSSNSNFSGVNPEYFETDDEKEQWLQSYMNGQIQDLNTHASQGGSYNSGATSGVSNPFASAPRTSDTTGASGASGTTGASGTSGPASTSVNNNAISANGTDWGKYGYNAEKGKKLAQTAISKHANSGSRGYCLRGVSQTVKATLNDNTLSGLGSAYMAADPLAKDSNFQEIKGLSSDEMKQLPAGSIIVWGNYGKHGHITMTDGNNNWYSDHYDNYNVVDYYTKKGATHRVFIPA